MQPFLEREEIAPYLFPVLLVASFITAILVQYCNMPWTDLAWLTWGVEEMRHGARLYKDIFEPNPPLIYWLYMPVVMLADAFSWQPVVTLKMLVIALIAIVTVASARILSHSPIWRGKNGKSLVLAIAGLLLLMPDSLETFAQREHLFVIFSLPYFLMYLPSVGRAAFSRPAQCAAGLFAGLGFCIKPPFFFIWLALLAYKYAKSRSLSRLIEWPEAMVILAAVVYLAALCVFIPQVFDWGKIMLQLYGSNGGLGETPLKKAAKFAIILSIGIAFLWRFRLWQGAPDGTGTPDARYLLWLAIAAFIEALIQFKTWHYIIYPWRAFGLLTVAAVIILRPLLGFLAFALIAWSFAPLTPLDDGRQEAYAKLYSRLTHALEPYRQSKDIYYFALGFAPPQLYRTQPPLKWAGAFGFYAFILQGMMEWSPDSGHPTLIVRPGAEALERWALDAIAHDLETKKPELIVIERGWDTEYSMDQSFDFLEWLKREPAIANFLGSYTLREQVELCAEPDDPSVTLRCSFKIYTRNGTGR